MRLLHEWGTSGPPAAGQLGPERVEALRPEGADLLDPLLHLVEAAGGEGVDPALGVGPHLHHPGLPEHPQVPGDRRPADREVGGDLARR